ncbi:MAG: DUF3365 domain-containing protein [Bacteroidales bacterium]
MKTLLSLILVSLLLAGCKSQQNKNDQEIIEKGAEISESLVQAIMVKLKAEIQENGVTGAINYCSVHALPITDSISREEKVEISRVAHKFRNPSNAANKKELEIIEKYIQQQKAGEQLAPEVVTVKGQQIYYAPIILGAPLCLSCHGPYNTIAPDVRNVLNEKYPDDQAVDFNLKEVRGMFKIVFEEERKGER